MWFLGRSALTNIWKVVETGNQKIFREVCLNCLSCLSPQVPKRSPFRSPWRSPKATRVLRLGLQFASWGSIGQGTVQWCGWSCGSSWFYILTAMKNVEVHTPLCHFQCFPYGKNQVRPVSNLRQSRAIYSRYVCRVRRHSFYIRLLKPSRDILHVDLFGRHLSAQADQIWNYCSTFTSHQEPNKDKPNFKTARILRFPPQFERLLLQVWEKIPDSLDILMTHGPAYSIPAKSILQEGAAGR